RPGEQQGHGGKGGWHPTAIDAKLDRAPINSLEQPEKCLVQAVGVQAVFLDVRVLMRHSRFLSGEVVGQASLVVKHDLSHKPQLHQDFFCKSTKRVNGVAWHSITASCPFTNGRPCPSHVPGNGCLHESRQRACERGPGSWSSHSPGSSGRRWRAQPRRSIHPPPCST